MRILDSAGSQPFVSYVIPVYNREREIKVLLESIGRQTYRATETIVVDDGSTDNSAQVSLETMKDLNMKGDVVRNGANRGRQFSRDVGLARARGDFVWFLDSDMIVPPDATAACVRACVTEELHGVMIPERSVGAGLWARCRELEKRINDYDLLKMSIRFAKREIALQVGGHATNHVADDYDFHNRLVRLGIRYRFLEETYIFHKEVDSVKGMITKYYHYGRTMMSYVRKYPTESFEQFSPLRPAYLTARKILAEDPLLAIAFLSLKTLQYVAALSGVLSSAFARSPAVH